MRVPTRRSRSGEDLKRVFNEIGDVRDVYIPLDYHTRCACALYAWARALCGD